MNRAIRSLLVLFLSALLLPACGADEYATDEFYAQDARSIENAVNGNRMGVIPVSVFGGITFIPNRFVLLARSENGIEFFSKGAGDLPDPRALSGFVFLHTNVDAIALVEKRRLAATNLFRTDPKSTVVDKFDVCILVDSYARGSQETQYVYIYDSDELLIINDPNEKLWEHVVDAYRASDKAQEGARNNSDMASCIQK